MLIRFALMLAGLVAGNIGWVMLRQDLVFSVLSFVLAGIFVFWGFVVKAN
jgi:hypothetical protein